MELFSDCLYTLLLGKFEDFNLDSTGLTLMISVQILIYHQLGVWPTYIWTNTT